MGGDAADVFGQDKILSEPRRKSIPDFFVPDDVVRVAKLGAMALADVILRAELETAGAPPLAHHLRLDDGRMVGGKALHAPAVKRAALEIEVHRLEGRAIRLT